MLAKVQGKACTGASPQFERLGYLRWRRIERTSELGRHLHRRGVIAGQDTISIVERRFASQIVVADGVMYLQHYPALAQELEDTAVKREDGCATGSRVTHRAEAEGLRRK